jgi:anti-sigma regulatory factor (Ser/Thr protein kinase)
VSRQTFAHSPASVAAARRFALEAIGDVPPPVVEAVTIAVSELATNCVRHAGTEFTVDVERTPDRLRIEVADTGTGTPTIRSPRPTVPTGRGLQLVRALSDDWGVTFRDDQSGKRVWFTIDLARQSSSSASEQTPLRSERIS